MTHSTADNPQNTIACSGKAAMLKSRGEKKQGRRRDLVAQRKERGRDDRAGGGSSHIGVTLNRT